MNIYLLLFASYKSQQHQLNDMEERKKKNEQKTILFGLCLSTCTVAVVTRTGSGRFGLQSNKMDDNLSFAYSVECQWGIAATHNDNENVAIFCIRHLREDSKKTTHKWTLDWKCQVMQL